MRELMIGVPKSKVACNEMHLMVLLGESDCVCRLWHRNIEAYRLLVSEDYVLGHIFFGSFSWQLAIFRIEKVQPRP